MKYINQALGDNAKFYPNYLVNHVASDFKFHLNNGIKRIADDNDRMMEEIAELKGAINQLLKYNGILTSGNSAVVNAKELLAKLSKDK